MNFRSTLGLLALGAGAVAAAGAIGGNVLYNLAIKPGGFQKLIQGTGKLVKQPEDINDDLIGAFFHPELTAWFDTASQIRSMCAQDGTQLKAYFFPRPSDVYAIVCHGYMSEGHGMSPFAKHYYDMGYNVLLPDARGHGISAGEYIGMGWPERFDLIGWIQLLLEENPNALIFMHGLSMGGATVMMTAGEPLPAAVRFAVEDCGYASVWDEFSCQLKGLFHLPAFPLLHFARAVAKVRAGYDFKEASALAQVKKASIPMLFIHGDADTFVPYSHLDQLYESAACPKEKLVVPGAAHAMSLFTDAERYWRTVDTFAAKYLTTSAYN